MGPARDILLAALGVVVFFGVVAGFWAMPVSPWVKFYAAMLIRPLYTAVVLIARRAKRKRRRVPPQNP